MMETKNKLCSLFDEFNFEISEELIERCKIVIVIDYLYFLELLIDLSNFGPVCFFFY